MNKLIEQLKYEERAAFDLRGLYESNGYKKVRVSKFEEYSLYIDNKNFLKTENIITFMDLDGKLLALRPDVTLSIVKNLDAQNAGCFEKLYYSEKVYRLARQNHAYKEISQTGLECIGDIDECAVIEVLRLALGSLSAIGGRSMLAVSHMGFLSGLLETLNFTSDMRAALMQSLKHKNTVELEALLTRAKLPPDFCKKAMQIPLLCGEFGAVLTMAQGLVLNDTMQNALDELAVVYSAFEGTETEQGLSLDFSVANDLDYYNGIIFQGYIDGIPKAVLSGGRYDNLLRKFGKDKGAIGFAVYLDELEHYYKHEDENDADVLVLYDVIDDYKAFEALINERVAQGLRVRTEREAPQGFKCGEVLRYKNGMLMKEA